MRLYTAAAFSPDELSADLANELEHAGSDEDVNLCLSGMWASCNDARRFTRYGDPAMRLNAALRGRSLIIPGAAKTALR